MKKKVLSLMLASAMVVSMTACGGSDAPVSSEASSSESVAESSSSEEVAEAPKSMAEQIEGMSYDEASTYLFNANMGDYYEAYMAAKEIVDDADLRWASMAIAEAKLLESESLIMSSV